jgi:hypothetical protein
MSDTPPPARPQTFAEKLAERPRTRFFTVFAILGFTATPAAIAILCFPPSETGSATGSAPPKVRVEVIIAAVLIALHLLCIFFAWNFWRNEAPKPRTDHPDPE